MLRDCGQQSADGVCGGHHVSALRDIIRRRTRGFGFGRTRFAPLRTRPHRQGSGTRNDTASVRISTFQSD
ncbi:hypothetical protein Q5P01_003733 [Channa striata]|uniref:Uncharacterized protein n=1 Tax=Channa striata TaxID=64152 RepID=A0AA88NGG9_CHASR|nr:hypothetical protein Q5P01_003733 [Channa striata]